MVGTRAGAAGFQACTCIRPLGFAWRCRHGWETSASDLTSINLT